jgi:hypothetical protein
MHTALTRLRDKGEGADYPHLRLSDSPSKPYQDAVTKDFHLSLLTTTKSSLMPLPLSTTSYHSD